MSLKRRRFAKETRIALAAAGGLADDRMKEIVASSTQGMDADGERARRVTCPSARFPVKVDERAESMKVAADNGDHKRQSQGASACEGLPGAADAKPDWNPFLMRPWKNALAA